MFYIHKVHLSGDSQIKDFHFPTFHVVKYFCPHAALSSQIKRLAHLDLFVSSRDIQGYY